MRLLTDRARHFVSLIRPSLILLYIFPFLTGILLGYPHRTGEWISVILVAAASFFFLSGSNSINEYFDYLSGVDAKTQSSGESMLTTPGVILSGHFTPGQVLWISVVLYAAGFICAASVFMQMGWEAGLACVVLGLLSYFYSAPPLSLAYRGFFSGEVLVFICFGVFPVMISARAVSGCFSLESLAYSIPFAILAAVLLIEHDFLHFTADTIHKKNTPVVLFGYDFSLKLVALLIALAVCSQVFLIRYEVNPYLLSLMLIGVYPLVKAWKRARSRHPNDVLPLIEITSNLVFTIFLISGISLLLR